MVDDLRAAWIIARAIIRSKAEHPFTLFFNTLVNMLDVVGPTIAIAALTHTFGTLGGWEFSEVLLLLGTSNACLGLSLLLMGAFDSFLFMSIFRSGQFESALLRPGSPVTFLAAVSLRPYRIGRVLASFTLLVTAIVLLGSEWWKAFAVMPLAVMSGTVILSALWLFDGAATVRLGQANDLTRNVPFVSTDLGLFPNGLYPTAGRVVAQFVLGIGAAVYLPYAFVLDKGPHFGVLSLVIAPLVAPVIVFCGRSSWRRAITFFESGGDKS